MNFNEDFSAVSYQLRAYGQSWIQINEIRLEQSFILAPELLIPDWEPESFRHLQTQHLTPLFQARAEIILLGTGNAQTLPSPEVYQALVRNGTGFELMSTAAACRTYNVLTSEGRSVIAALFPS